LRKTQAVCHLHYSTSHGRSRPSFIHRSKQPFDISEFEQVSASRLEDGQQIPIDNFSYMQIWYAEEMGFHAFFTRYSYPAARTICYMSSRDGVLWSPWQRIAAIDGGQTWQSVDGEQLELPLQQKHNAALVYDYQAEQTVVYLKDLRIDNNGYPLLLYITSKGYEAGPKNNPRTWTLARWNGEQWLVSTITQSDNNYDMGELWLVAEDDWRVIAPTGTAPQAYNPGGEVVMWQSRDRGATWALLREMTSSSPRNHTYVRRALNAHPDFVAFWADGHGRQPSESRLYFSNLAGDVFQLPAPLAGTRIPTNIAVGNLPETTWQASIDGSSSGRRWRCPIGRANRAHFHQAHIPPAVWVPPD
jgi:hypothetical protein